MQFKQISVLVSLTSLVANTLAASYKYTSPVSYEFPPDSPSDWFRREGKHPLIQGFGYNFVDLDLDCNGRPCNYDVLFRNYDDIVAARTAIGFTVDLNRPEFIFDNTPSWQDYDDEYYCLPGDRHVDASAGEPYCG
ncbi:MAG: hypothetical protein J3R72DRAFT_457222 [Linnemannia gamsii]|nr:MAG: hypothetical protein J3R72DRAFT_457222 [Linnemannia gamsii]